MKGGGGGGALVPCVVPTS